MSDLVNAAGGIFVFFQEGDEPVIGLQKREDTDEWGATGGIIEDYDDVGLGMYDTIMNCIQRECLEEIGTVFNLDEVQVSLPQGSVSHFKQKLESHSGHYYTLFISLSEMAYGDMIDNLELNPTEVSDFEFRILSDWLSDSDLHDKVRDIISK